jgi:hypothetical protein
MFIVVPSLDFRNQQGHNSDALLGGEIRSNEASGGRFGHGPRRFRERSETHPLTFRLFARVLGSPLHKSPRKSVPSSRTVHRPHIFSADGFAFVIQSSASGLKALAQGGEAIAYRSPGDAAGIDNSAAIELDTFANEWDVVGDINGPARTLG